jgi:Mitochondrial ribosomal protein subunit L20
MKALVLRARWSSGAPQLSHRPHLHSGHHFIPRHALRIHPPSSRHAATSRRTTKALRLKPAPTAAPASKRLALAQNTIVFNPPPTPPSPYQTPPLFLPPSDPRRTLLAPSYAHDNPYRRTATAAPSNAVTLPPAINQPTEKKYHLGPAEIEEIRQLRASNPWVWTKKRLAEKFGCSEYFVVMCAQAVPERVDWAKEHLERIKSRWGPKRTKAREEREKRRTLWQRDE